jgi:hypothetical protein
VVAHCRRTRQRWWLGGWVGDGWWLAGFSLDDWWLVTDASTREFGVGCGTWLLAWMAGMGWAGPTRGSLE